MDARRLVRVLHRGQRQRRERDRRRLLRPRRSGRLPCLAVERLAGRGDRRPQLLRAARDAARRRSSVRLYLPLTLRLSSVRRSLSMYWCQPLYWPLGGRSKRLIRPSRPLHSAAAEPVAEPRVGDPLPGRVDDHRAGVVDLAVEVGVDARAARGVPRVERGDQLRGAPRVGDLPLASIAFSVGHSCVIRTSSVAPALAAASTLASVAFGIARELAVEHVHALDAALVAEAVVTGREVLGRLVVPVDDVARSTG